MARKFKRYHVPPSQGKGSDRREPQVSDQQLAENWCDTFGCEQANATDMRCSRCGRTPEQKYGITY